MTGPDFERGKGGKLGVSGRRPPLRRSERNVELGLAETPLEFGTVDGRVAIRCREPEKLKNPFLAHDLAERLPRRAYRRGDGWVVIGDDGDRSQVLSEVRLEVYFRFPDFRPNRAVFRRVVRSLAARNPIE
jgi:hypothetical protein